MPQETGRIESIKKKTNSSNDDYLLVTIEGTTFFCWDKSLFPEFTEGRTVEVGYTANEDGEDVYRNINSVESVENSKEPEESVGGDAMRRAKALELAIYYVDVEDTERKVKEIADMFLQYMNG